MFCALFIASATSPSSRRVTLSRRSGRSSRGCSSARARRLRRPGEQAIVLVGGLGGVAGLLAAYGLAFPTRRTLGIVPASVFFCATTLFLAETINFLEGEPGRKLLELLQGPFSSEQFIDHQLE